MLVHWRAICDVLFLSVRGVFVGGTFGVVGDGLAVRVAVCFACCGILRRCFLQFFLREPDCGRLGGASLCGVYAKKAVIYRKNK